MAEGSDIYTIEMIDLISAPSARAAAAQRNVYRATLNTSDALKTGDRAQIKAAQSAQKLAAAELRAAGAWNKLETAAGRGGAERGVFGELLSQVPVLGPALSRFGAGPLALVGVALAGVYAAGKKAFELTNIVDRYSGSLTNLEGSSSKAAEDLELIRQTALALGDPFEQTAEAFTKFRRQGLQPQDAAQYVKFQADLAALGQTSEEAGTALESLTKILIAGKASPKALVALEKAGVPAQQALADIAKKSGKTYAQIEEDFKKGKVDAVEFGNAVETAFERKYSSKEFGALDAAYDLNTVAGNIDDIKAKLESGLLLPLLGATGHNNLNDALVRPLQAINEVLDPTTLEAAAKVLEAIGAGLGALGSIAKVVFYPIKLLFDVVGNFGAARGRADAIAAQVEDLKRLNKEAGAAIPDGMAAGVAASAPSATNAVVEMANSASQAGADALGIHSPSKIFATQGQQIDAGLAHGIDADADLAFTAAREMTEGTVAAAEQVTAPGGSVARVGADAGSLSIGGGSGGVTVSVGDISVGIQGGGDPSTAAAAVRDWFEQNFAAMLERTLEGVGA